MKTEPEQRERLRFLARVVQREQEHLATTDARVFDKPFTPQRARGLSDNVNEAERVAAFVSRFGRLQDTLGDSASNNQGADPIGAIVGHGEAP